jgi:hypothetical protein
MNFDQKCTVATVVLLVVTMIILVTWTMIVNR